MSWMVEWEEYRNQPEGPAYEVVKFPDGRLEIGEVTELRGEVLMQSWEKSDCEKYIEECATLFAEK